MSNQLIDLDELVLKCRDEMARQYIAEAVACYKVGALRACIVTTWIAVVYDFIHKLRQLEMAGDRNAAKHLGDFEKTRRQQDTQRSLEFEKRVLDMAQNEFELISPLQYQDLVRLREDRHRCAHPSMMTEEIIYQPSSETARYHLRNAIEYLLEHPPVQGKAALGRLEADVTSSYFPITVPEAKTLLQQGPLGRPKDALVRNFTIVLLKGLVLEDPSSQKQRDRFTAALIAVREIHREVVERTLSEEMTKTTRRANDEVMLGRVVEFLARISDTWQYLGLDGEIWLQEYIKGLSETDNNIVEHALSVPELRPLVLERLAAADVSLLSRQISFQPHKEYIPIALDKLADADDFGEANSMSINLVRPDRYPIK